MPNYRNLDELPARARVAIGGSVAFFGLAAAAAMYAQPERLRVPVWLGVVVCLCFVVTGAAVALHGLISAKLRDWFVVVLLAMMTAIPAWIAFGPGARSCNSNLPYLSGGLGCRVAFGIAALVLLLMLGIALVRAWRARPDSS
jgi:hypothetical protein